MTEAFTSIADQIQQRLAAGGSEPEGGAAAVDMNAKKTGGKKCC